MYTNEVTLSLFVNYYNICEYNASTTSELAEEVTICFMHNSTFPGGEVLSPRNISEVSGHTGRPAPVRMRTSHTVCSPSGCAHYNLRAGRLH